MKFRVILFSLLFMLIAGCNEKDNYQVDLKEHYFPTDSGRYVIYEVDSIKYRYTNPLYFRDSVKYQLRVEIGDTFYDNENRLNRKVLLHRRSTSTQPWQLDRVWHLYNAGNNVQLTEGDIRFVKLVFPPIEGNTWDGNLYAPKTGPYEYLKDWNYTYAEVDVPYSINSFQFDSTLTVDAVDEESVIEKIRMKEVYAKNVGLVYKEWDYLQKQRVDVSWDSLIESGFRIRYKVIDHN